MNASDSEDHPEAEGTSQAAAGWGLAISTAAFAAITFWGIGPRFEKRAFYDPSGKLAQWLGATDLSPVVDELGPALWTFGLVAAALTVGVFFVTRAALPRFLAIWSFVATLCFVYYGLEASFVWSFFRWRWSGSMVLFAATVAAALSAPLLAASWLRLRWPGRILSYLPIFLCVLVYERNVTGTDQALRFAISPWPVVQIFGLELIAMCVGALVLGVGLGLAVSKTARASGRPWLHIAGATLAVALPALALAAASAQQLLPGRLDARLLGLVGALSFSSFALAAFLGVDSPQRLGFRAKAWVVGGLLVLLATLVGQAWARLDYTRNREHRAAAVIDSLASHWEREEMYPDKLSELVASGDIDAIPEPVVGFGFLGRESFVYQNFGDSYILEFSAPRWIQCAYNPPYPEEYEDEEDDEEEEDETLGAGAWSCPSNPPELW